MWSSDGLEEGLSDPSLVAKKMAAPKPKMDAAKAMLTLGLGSSRSLDPANGHDPRTELNAALSKRMLELERKKQRSIAQEASGSDKKRSSRARGSQTSGDRERQRDDVRVLHEAYQFLLRKYVPHHQEQQGESEEQPEDAPLVNEHSENDN